MVGPNPGPLSVEAFSSDQHKEQCAGLHPQRRNGPIESNVFGVELINPIMGISPGGGFQGEVSTGVSRAWTTHTHTVLLGHSKVPMTSEERAAIAAVLAPLSLSSSHVHTDVSSGP